MIGGGVVGASVLYHLAKLGWTDTVLLERSVLTAGSSWHAAGGFHAFNSDPNIAALQAYTINLFSEIQKESGVDIGMHMTGGYSIATTTDRWEWLQSAYRVFQTMGIDDMHLANRDEVAAACPIIKAHDVIGALHADREGHIDPAAVVHAYVKAARRRGADVVEHNRVISISPRADGAWRVETEKGTVVAEHVVNAAGLWAKPVGRMVGLDLPIVPLQHHFLVTEPVPELQSLKRELPLIVDLDGFTYLRQEQKGLLLGVYERDYRHWNEDGPPWDFGMELIPEDIDRISTELEIGFDRYPCLATVGIRRWINGAFTFSPDGNPIVGPARGLRNFWLACGVMAGFLQGGGVGKALAEWIVEGEPELDLFGMDGARYGPYASNAEFVKQTTGQFYSRRFAMSYPNEQLTAGRPIRVPGAYAEMTAAGARWDSTFGLEFPRYFAPPSFTEKPSLRRSNAFDIIRRECRQARSTTGLLDITASARYEVSGPAAIEWLDYLLACKLPEPGKMCRAIMLSDAGKLKGDLIIINWGDGSWWLVGPYAVREWHSRWFADNQMGGAHCRDISDSYGGFLLAGPRSRDVLRRFNDDDALSELSKNNACTQIDIGLIRCKVRRTATFGEIGYEFDCLGAEHAALRSSLLNAGQEIGLGEIGYEAANSLRLEKSQGLWLRDYKPSFTPLMACVDGAIDRQKEFRGKEAFELELEEGGPNEILVTLEVASEDADCWGYEPVWREGKRIGYVTTGGYGHTLEKSLALAIVSRQSATPGTDVCVHVVGKERRATVIANSPYDPHGLALSV